MKFEKLKLEKSIQNFRRVTIYHMSLSVYGEFR